MVNEKKKEKKTTSGIENGVRIIYMKSLSNLVFSVQLAGIFS